MIIVLPEIAIHQIAVFCREHTIENYTVDVINEQSNKLTSIDVTGVYDGNKLTFELPFIFEKQRWYMIKVFTNIDILINHSKIYCTDQQDFEKYSVLDGYYHQIDKPRHEYITKK